MSSVDDVYAAASSAETPLEEAHQQATSAGKEAGETTTGLQTTESNARQLAEKSNAIGMKPKAAQAEAVRAEAEALAARAAAVTQQLAEAAGELAELKQEHTELLARIQALSG